MIKIILFFILLLAIFYVLTVFYFDSALRYGERNRLPAAVKIEETANNLNQWISDILGQFPKP